MGSSFPDNLKWFFLRQGLKNAHLLPHVRLIISVFHTKLYFTTRFLSRVKNISIVWDRNKNTKQLTSFVEFRVVFILPNESIGIESGFAKEEGAFLICKYVEEKDWFLTSDDIEANRWLAGNQRTCLTTFHIQRGILPILISYLWEVSNASDWYSKSHFYYNTSSES